MKELSFEFPELTIGDTLCHPVLYENHFDYLKEKKPLFLEKMKFHHVHIVDIRENHLYLLVSNTFKENNEENNQTKGKSYTKSEIDDLIKNQGWRKVTENIAFSATETSIFYWNLTIKKKGKEEESTIFTIKLNWWICYEIFPGINLFLANKENCFSESFNKKNEISSIINTYKSESQFVKINYQTFCNLVAFNIWKNSQYKRKKQTNK